MLRNVMLLLGLFVLVGFTYAIAEPGSTYQPQDRQDEERPQVQTKSVVGTIVSVDTAKNKITIKDEVTGEADEYSYNDATEFQANGTLVTIDKVNTGDRVSLEVESEGDLIVALHNPSTVPLKD